MNQFLRLIIFFGVGYLVGAFLGFMWANTIHADVLNPKFKIAIIDTGYNTSATNIQKTRLKLCKTGHFNFVSGKDEIGTPTLLHGTIVGTVLAEELKDVDYCAVIYTVQFDNAAESVISALYKASSEQVVAVNASWSSYLKSVGEREALRDATRNANVFVAAGNDRMNLDYACLAFPSCFDIPKMHVVGALDPTTGRRFGDSNYGTKVKEWFSGAFGEHHGTSFAAPRALASYVRYLNRPVVTATKTH